MAASFSSSTTSVLATAALPTETTTAVLPTETTTSPETKTMNMETKTPEEKAIQASKISYTRVQYPDTHFSLATGDKGEAWHVATVIVDKFCVTEQKIGEICSCTRWYKKKISSCCGGYEEQKKKTKKPRRASVRGESESKRCARLSQSGVSEK